MPIFSKDGNNLLFIHIPKTGGSSVERIGSELGWEESFSVRGKPLEDLTFYKATLQHLHAEALECILNLESFEHIFTVVRNPFSRLKSEYYWQRIQGITSLRVDEWIDDSFIRYFDNPYIFDNHIRPQIDFIPDGKDVAIFKLEESGIEKVEELLSKFSSGGYGFGSMKRGFALKSLKIRKEKFSKKDAEVEAKFQRHYQKIVDFYEKDFSAFSYKI